MDTPTPRPARSPLSKAWSDIRHSTLALLGIQAGAILLNTLSYLYDRATGSWSGVIAAALLMPIVYVLCGILGLVQASRSFRARKHVMLNALLLGTSIFVVTAGPPKTLAHRLCDAMLPFKQKFMSPEEAKLHDVLEANMKAKYDELSAVFQKPVRVVAVHGQYLTLGDGHVVFLLGPVLTLEDLDTFGPFVNERLMGKDIMMRLPEFLDFEAVYSGDVLPDEIHRPERIPVVIVLDGELINAKFGYTGAWLVKKYGPKH